MKQMNKVKKLLTGPTAKNFLGVVTILALLLFMHIINRQLRTVALVIVIGGIIYLVTNNEYEAVIGAVLFGIVYNLPSLLYGNKVEGFEDGDGEDDSKEKKENKEEYNDEDTLELIEKLESDLTASMKMKKKADANENELAKLSDKKELGLTDEERYQNENSTSNLSVDEHSPASAQRETFRLINTVKQLDTTIKELAPTLKSGKKIIEAYQKLTFRK